MQPHECLTAALDTLGWSSRELTRRLGNTHASTRQMLAGKRHIPRVLMVWVEDLAEAIAAIPLPVIDGRGSVMPAGDLRTLLQDIGWSFDVAAERVAPDRVSMARMVYGQAPVPTDSVRYMHAVLDVIRSHPARPDGWGNPGRHRIQAA